MEIKNKSLKSRNPLIYQYTLLCKLCNDKTIVERPPKEEIELSRLKCRCEIIAEHTPEPIPQVIVQEEPKKIEVKKTISKPKNKKRGKK